MKLAEIKELSAGEVVEQIEKSRLDLVNLRMKFASRQLEDVSQLRKKKKEIAWLHTVKTQKLGEEGLGEVLEQKSKPKKKTKKVTAEKPKKTTRRTKTK